MSILKFHDSIIMAVYIVLQVPSRIEKLIAEKQYYAAVQLHVQSALMLEREGLQTVDNLFGSTIIQYNMT